MNTLNVALGLVISLCASTAFAIGIWMEAENGAEYNPIIVGSDTTATDDTFLVSWRSSDYSERSYDDGHITFDITIPEAGIYHFWGRIRVPFSGAQPYDISFGSGDPNDDEQWTLWAPDERLEAEIPVWQWRHSGVARWLTQGTHRIHLIQRVGGSETHIDKILFTDDPEFIPSGEGQPEDQLDIINPYQSSSVTTHGQLKIVGGQIVNAQNQPVQLQGISLHGLQWFPIANQQTIPAMAEFFGVEMVRLAMYVEDYDPRNSDIFWGGYMSNPEKMTKRVEAAIQDAIDAGIYVIVDWHIHDAPSKYTEEATTFFTHIAEKFGQYPNVIYEICNEPVAASWQYGIKPYAEQVIQAIRAHDPDNLIIVGAPNWSQDIDDVVEDPLSGSNLLYAFHFYAGTHGIHWAKQKLESARSANLAVIVSEWGSSDVGTSRSNFSVANEWIEYLKQHNISWANWSLGLKDETSSILKPDAPISGPWLDRDLTEAGSWLKPHFDPPSSTDPNTNPTPDPDPTPDPNPTTVHIEAETLSDSIGNIQVTSVIGYVNLGEGFIYKNIQFDHLKQIKLYTASRHSGHQIEFRQGSITGPLLGAYTTVSSGGWNTYQWQTIDLEPSTGTGDLVMYVNPNIGENKGILNLDYFTLTYQGGSAGYAPPMVTPDAPNIPDGTPEDANQFQFDFETSTHGWSTVNIHSIEHDNGWISGVPQHDPQFRSGTFSLDSQHYSSVQIQYQSASAGHLKMFWSTVDQHFNADSKISVPIEAGIHTVTLQLSDHSYWRGSIGKIRIDMPSLPGVGRVGLGDVRFEGNAN